MQFGRDRRQHRIGRQRPSDRRGVACFPATIATGDQAECGSGVALRQKFATRAKTEIELTATDMAKRLLDYGFHAPTIYFPLLVPECLLIEPSETEDRDALDAFVEAMVAIWQEARADIEMVKGVPYSQPVWRLDDVRAARQLDLTWTAG